MNELYNNLGNCVNIPSDTCGCCDILKEFYEQAKQWYENIMKILNPEEESEDPTVVYSTITFKINPNNGCGYIKQVINNNYTNIPASNNYIVGSAITLQAIPISGYLFSEWSSGNESLGTSARLNYKVTNENVTITAKFIRQEVNPSQVTYDWYIGAGDNSNAVINDTNLHTYNPSIQGDEVTEDITVSVPETGNHVFIIMPTDMVIKNITQANFSFLNNLQVITTGVKINGVSMTIYLKKTNKDVGEFEGDNQYKITYGVAI